MKNIIFVISFFLILNITTSDFSDAGPPIPIPKISINEACSIAMNYFYSKENRFIDPKYFKGKDYILISANYTNHFNDKFEKIWAWKIVFVHPVQNDHSVAYKITDDKKVVFLYATE